jgi:hypothetical protein
MLEFHGALAQARGATFAGTSSWARGKPLTVHEPLYVADIALIVGVLVPDIMIGGRDVPAVQGMDCCEGTAFSMLTVSVMFEQLRRRRGRPRIERASGAQAAMLRVLI